MSAKPFIISKGRWDVPRVGKIDSSQEISDNQLFELYKLHRPAFPWIKLGPGAETFLKKQKLNVKEIAAMVLNAQTVEETELLAKLSDAKAVAGVVETHLKAFKNDQQK